MMPRGAARASRNVTQVLSWMQWDPQGRQHTYCAVSKRICTDDSGKRTDGVASAWHTSEPIASKQVQCQCLPQHHPYRTLSFDIRAIDTILAACTAREAGWPGCQDASHLLRGLH